MFFLLCYEDLKKKYQISRKWFGLIKEGLTFLTDPGAHDNRPQVEYFREFILKNRDKSVEEIVDAVIKSGIGKEFAGG